MHFCANIEVVSENVLAYVLDAGSPMLVCLGSLGFEHLVYSARTDPNHRDARLGGGGEWQRLTSRSAGTASQAPACMQDATVLRHAGRGCPS